MFESRTPFSPHATERTSEAGAQADLRPVSWTEINARLAAARELRIALGQGESGPAASFNAGLARHVAHLHDEHEPDGNNRVNRDLSTNGKHADGTHGPSNEDRRPATRGTE